MKALKISPVLLLLVSLAAIPARSLPQRSVSAASSPSPSPPGADGGAPNGAMIKLWVLAEGPGRKLVLDLTAQDFQVFDDGRPQNVAYFAPRSREPLSLGILIETSRSRLYESDPAGWRPYSELLHKLLVPGDRAFVASFAEKTALEGGFTDSLAKLDETLRQVFRAPSEGTAALYDAIDTLCAERFAGSPGRRALLVVSDSPGYYTDHDRMQTLERVERADVTIYSLLPWVDRTFQPPFGDIQFAQFFADQTGGLFYMAASPKALARDAEGIAAALAYTYTLGYVPRAAANDGRYHSVKVKCTRPGVKLHVAQGYYSPGPS